jgi:hypothetical protein
MAKQIYQPITSYPASTNRLLTIDWAGYSYQTIFAMAAALKRESPEPFTGGLIYHETKDSIDTPEDLMRVWKKRMFMRVLDLVRLFNPMDIVIALEGRKLWRSEYYNDYYKKNTAITYDKDGFYVRFDNFLYRMSKVNGIILPQKLDPTDKVSDKSVPLDKLSPDAKAAIDELIPKYKGTRSKQDWPFCITKKEWKKQAEQFAIEMAPMFRAICIRIDAAEGDDIMYFVARHGANKYDSVILATRDGDMVQTMTQKNVAIFDPHNCVMKECADPAVALTLKVLHGDKGDNINGIALPGKKQQLGEKTAQTLFESAGANLVKKAQDEKWYDQYLRNRTLIDISMVPTEVQKAICDAFDTATPTLIPIDQSMAFPIDSEKLMAYQAVRRLGYYTTADRSVAISDPPNFKSHLVVSDINVQVAEMSRSFGTISEPEIIIDWDSI